MGAHGVDGIRDEERGALVRAIIEDLRALDWMLDRGLVESGVHRLGAEQEVFLVDQGGRPLPVATDVLPGLSASQFSGEVGRFNLEANLAPRVLGSGCLTALEQECRTLLKQAAARAAEFGAGIVLTGTLPGLERSHVTARHMMPGTRFELLDRATVGAHGGEVQVRIRGLDDLELGVDSMMLESCPTSFQVHLQVSPGEFARAWNASLVAIGPVLAMAANSPLLLGRRLWHETRIPLVEAAAEFRTRAQRRRGEPARALFGTRWVERSVTEIFRENLVRFRPLLTSRRSESSFEALQAGRLPDLVALTTHNGTVWRWMRPCFGVHGERAHLRIENRALPAGPTIPDQVANAAFWLGLVLALPQEYGDVRERMAFDDARANFYAAARNGLSAQLLWLDGERYDAAQLTSRKLLPLARAGLISAGLRGDEVAHYLSLIEARAETRQNGATWLLGAFDALEGSREARGRAVTQALLERSLADAPVHAWTPVQAPSADHPPLPTLGSLMTGELLTVRPEDPLVFAAEVLRWTGRPLVPVEDAQGRLVGVVTAQSLLAYFARHGAAAEGTVSAVATDDLVTAPVDMPLEEAMALVAAADASVLLVTQDDGGLLGAVTWRELLEALDGEGLAARVRERREARTPDALIH